MTIALAAIGATTSFGPTWQDARQALAANETPFHRQRGFIGTDFKPQLTGFAQIAADGPLIGRLKALSIQALADLFAQPASQSLTHGSHLALCAPDAREWIDNAEIIQMLQDLAAHLSAAHGVDVDGLSFATTGPVGCLTLMDDLRPKLDRGQSLIMVTVDSYNHRPRLRALTDAGALFSGQSPYGLIPGEAAAALLIGPATEDNAAPHRIGGFALAQDQIAEDESGDSDYGAMAQACQNAWLDGQTVDCLMTNWNNNRFRAAEISYTQLRTQNLQSPEFDVVHPALTFGDLGAAFPGVALALALDQTVNSLVAISGGPGQHLRGAISLIKAET